MYQLALRQFGRLPRIKLSPAPSLRALVRLAVEADGGRSESKLSTEAIIDVRPFPSLTSIIANDDTRRVEDLRIVDRTTRDARRVLLLQNRGRRGD
jgi:hypothetical protein